MSELDEEIDALQKMYDSSENVVFFGGAGVSTESGVPDFRSEDGLYHQKFDYPPETMLSHSFFMTHREEFYKFYDEKLLVEGIEPNAAHKKLAEMEAKGKLKAVVTQNIDGLHQKAGSKAVYELHGTVMKNYCMKCGKFFDLDYMLNAKHNGDKIPKCDSCGGDIKPDVVLYEEGLDNETVEGAVRAISNADMLIIGGTSLVVYPAAGLIDYYRWNKLVLINRDSTAADRRANLVIHGKIGEVLDKIKA